MTAMTAITELHVISQALRIACHKRWSDDNITNHVAVRLPAPIFDAISREVQHGLAYPEQKDTNFKSAVTSFTFEGIKFERIDGVHWSVRTGPGDPAR